MITRLQVNKEAVFIVLLMSVSLGVRGDDWQVAAMAMREEVQADMLTVTGKPLSEEVADALVSVPRHEFVPAALERQAYENRPLSIGENQTISQPFIVAFMTELLDLDSDARVLEIGTGSGYQAAILAVLCDQVYSIEIIDALASSAKRRLRRLGYRNVEVRHGDGMLGWPEQAPFDGIIVTAAGLEIPDRLLAQLKTGGKLVMPVGPVHEVQHLKVIEKTSSSFLERSVLPVRFVPITREVR
jgi:protein-L-isoaspartate(D-aspartate) O-methyltransferase